MNLNYQKILKEEEFRLRSYGWCSEEYIEREAPKAAMARINNANRRIIDKVCRANPADPHCPRVSGKPDVRIYGPDGHLDADASAATEAEITKIWYNWASVQAYAKKNEFELLADSNVGKYI